jgi:hypothetical protein
MNPTQTILRMLGGQARRPGRAAIYITTASTAIRLLRRVLNTRERTLLQFEIKPGEMFELRGVRRGR